MRVRAIGLIVSFFIGIGLPCTAEAQSTFEMLHNLFEPEYPPVGRLLEAPGGRLYGVVLGSPYWSKGALLAYDRQPDGTLASTVIHTFTGLDGALPSAGVIQGSDGALYGTTASGGPENQGTIYRIAPDGTFTVLHAFAAALGGGPGTELVEAEDGHLYGNFSGGIFRITKAGALSVVTSGGSSVVALVDGHDGRFYGIQNGNGVGGNVFSVTLDGVLTILHTFTRPGPIGPTSLIDGRDGFLYGTTWDAFDDSRSALFRISRSGAFSVIFTNTVERTTLLHLENLIRGADGNFYGTTGGGGIDNQGTIYRITPTGVFSIVHHFQFAFGSGPNSLVQAADGTLMGSTFYGGFARRGVIFRSTIAGEYRVTHIFHGADPLRISTLLTEPDGAIYGASCGGGLLNAGTIFKLTSNATVLTVLHSFAYWDGMCPSGRMAFGADGAIYGTASRSGLGGGGTIFRITTSGAFSVLRFLLLTGSDGATPGGLMRASDGNLYGTTSFGGEGAQGTVYRLSSAGFTVLGALQKSVWFRPFNSELIQARDGHLYGVSPFRPFRMTLAGVITYFDAVPALFAPLVEGADGNLYGVTPRYLGQSPILPGTLFRMTPAGATTVLHTFAATAEDPAPCGTMIAGPGGTLYGLGCSDTTGNFPGSIFAFSGTGPPITIHVFDPAVGSAPSQTLMFGADGALYGATEFGGPTFRGGIYRLRRP